MPVAVNASGDPVSPPLEAVSAFGPAAPPRVHEVCACPSMLVVALAGETLPPPWVTVKVTETPATGFPFASVARTTTFLESVLPAVALWAFPETIAIWLATPATPVSVKVRAETPEAVASATFVPALVPSVKLAETSPVESVAVERAATLPPPWLTEKLTGTPATAFPFASWAPTTSGASVVPAVALWLFPDWRTSFVAAPDVAVAVNVVGEPVSWPLAAVTVPGPAIRPSVHEARACPIEFVMTVVGETVPPPETTAKRTLAPGEGFPEPSRTVTQRGIGSVAPTAPV